MKLNILFVIHAVLGVIFGLGMVLMPGFLMSLYGAEEVVQVSPLFVQLFGSTLLGTAVLVWLMRNINDMAARRVVCMGYFVYFVIGTIVSTIAQLTGVYNFLGWSTPGHLLLFALAYAYFLFIRKDFT